MKKYFKVLSPFIYLFLIWGIFSSPYFTRGLVPFPSRYQVNFFAPWSLYEKFWSPIKNAAMPDVIDQIYPWKHFTIDMLRKGEVPFWNPNSFSGNPHLANFQTAVLSPFNALFFLLAFIDAWSILVLLQSILAGFFMYLFLRSLNRSKVAALLSGVTFMFCGFIVVWMAYGTLSMAIAILPLSLYAIEEYYKDGKKRYLIFLALSIPLSFFSGHFQTSLYYLLYTLFYFGFTFLKYKKHNRSIKILQSIIIGITISLVQIIPSIQFYFYSARSGIFIKNGGIPFSFLITMFSPDFYGNPVTRNDWFGQYAEWASFIGIIPLTLAFFGINRGKKSMFFFIAGIVSLLLAINSPVLQFIGLTRIPVISTSTPSRIIVLVSFSLAALSGIGLDNLMGLLSSTSKKKIFSILTISGFLVFLFWLVLYLGYLPPDKTVIAKRNLILPTALYGIFLTSIAFLLFVPFQKRKMYMFLPLILLFLSTFDSLRFAKKWMPFDPKNLVFPDVPIIHGIETNVNNGRIYGNFGAHLDTYYGFPSIEGYDPLYIDRYGEFLRSANTGAYEEPERSVAKLDRRGKYTDRVLDLLNVEIIYHPRADTNQGWAYPVWKDQERYKLVYQDDKYQLFRNTMAMERATVFYDYEIKQGREILKTFYKSDFDFKNVLILEENPVNLKKGSAQKSKGSVEVETYSSNRIKYRVTTSAPGLLFVSDNYYLGWKATVNNKEVKIYRADYTFRAVVVPKGSSTVEFKYSPSFF